MTAPPSPHLTPAERWRLLLGEAAQPSLQGGLGAGSASGMAMDRALAWLYGRGDAAQGADTLDRHGGTEGSQLSVPEWINQIHELFPKETIERLERDAIERYGIDEVVTNVEVLQRATPNPALLAAVMRTKHLMNPEVLAMARQLVAKVVQALIDKLAKELRRAFSGTRRRTELSYQGAASQFAARETLRRNLKTYDPERRRLIVQRPLFHTHQRKHLERWQILLVVDQSGSMVPSVIHAAITAACLWHLPGVQTHLIAFDTEIVDLTGEAHDPVETLMKVQLGGGTYIGKAVQYAAERIEVPKRAMVVVISDFYEGMSEYVLIDQVRSLVAQGTQVLGLAALDEQANPAYDRELARKLVEVGAHVGAMTPGQLAGWLAEKLE
ncbi:VWA domain-containing protein [Ottowia testudinis]|uniref:VWA domain-containing protein n=1 Tax=Ottowia testudinis TaxID=2816950 RepID=A0A975CIY3_9BURK|nr:VWA domain-containing protein [Ottowia testudinis]QTD46617.1 VWA domain-containing protein [Ottowia testudinis]